MNHLKTLLIFLVLFGVLALYRESIKTNIMKQREEKKMLIIIILTLKLKILYLR